MKTKRKASKHGQAMLEFALVGPIFFFCLFFALAAMLYAFERSLVVTGVTTGARSAASACSGCLLPNSPASLAQASQQARDLMANSLIGTNVVNLNSPTCAPVGGLPCAAIVAAQPCLVRGATPVLLPARKATVYIYATTACGNNEIQVVATGSPTSLISAFGFPDIPLTIQASAVGVQYQP